LARARPGRCLIPKARRRPRPVANNRMPEGGAVR
jgi:hypothetical protein